MKNWQPEVRTQAERPQVQYISIKDKKSHLRLRSASKDQENRLSAMTNCTYQDKRGGTKLYLKGWSEEQDLRRGTWEEAQT